MKDIFKKEYELDADDFKVHETLEEILDDINKTYKNSDIVPSDVETNIKSFWEKSDGGKKWGKRYFLLIKPKLSLLRKIAKHYPELLI